MDRVTPLLIVLISALALPVVAHAQASKIAVLPVQPGPGITEPIANGYDTQLRNALAAKGTVIPLGATKAAMTKTGLAVCTGGACGKKMAAASGARFIANAAITNSDEIYQVNVSLYDAANDKWSSSAGTCELCAANEVDGTIKAAVAKLGGALAAPLPKPKPKPKASEGMVKLEVISQPAGATVILDGKQAGETPLKTTVKAGQHEIILNKEGYKDITRKLSALDRAVTLNVKLEALPPPVAVAPPLAPTPPPPVVTPPEVIDSGESGSLSTAGWGLAVGGVALVGVGIWMTALDGEVTCSDGRGRTECPNLYNTKWLGAVGFGVGGALLASGITMLILDDSGTEAAFMPLPDGGAFSLGGTF